MHELLTAFQRAARDLLAPSVLVRVLWPPFVALALCALIGLGYWREGIALIQALVLPWLPTLPPAWEWMAPWAAGFLFVALLVALYYVTTVLLVAIVALPALIGFVACEHYADLARQGENAFVGSLLTTLSATLVFMVGGLLSLPLLLIPGVVLVLPLFWTAWLNQRTFRYDALAEHATPAELKALIARDRGGFLLAAVGCGLLAHLPVVNLLVPGYTALVFVHLGLQRLRALRAVVPASPGVSS